MAADLSTALPSLWTAIATVILLLGVVIWSGITGRRILHYTVVGAMLGAASGPLGLIPLYLNTPTITTRLMVAPPLAAVAVLMIAFGMVQSAQIHRPR